MNNFIKKWNGKTLQDDVCYVSKEFNTFQNAFKREVARIAQENGAELVSYIKGHYDMSGFIRKGKKYLYFNYSNYMKRNKVDFNNRQAFFCRIAKNENDYRGGVNNFMPFSVFESNFEKQINSNY